MFDQMKMKCELLLWAWSNRQFFIKVGQTMYVIRRVYEVKPGMARRYATIAMKMCEEYEAAGQRSPARIYFNGGTIPGERNRVYMEWIADIVESPYREGNVIPQSVRDAGSEGRDMVIDNWIEFYELMTPPKSDHG